MMKTYRITLILLLSFFVTLSFHSPDAHASRRASLAHNQLIEDKNDVFTFPQLSTQYTNLATFEYGTIENQGSGLFLYKVNSLAVGVGIHRGDAIYRSSFPLTGAEQLSINPLNTPLNVDGTPSPATIVDFIIGTEMGQNQLGARLSLGLGRTTAQQPDAEKDSTQEFYAALTAGYTMTGNLRLDSALRVVLNNGYVAPQNETVASGSILEIGIGARGYFNTDTNVELGFLGELGFATGSGTINANDVSVNSSSSGVLISAGAGPVFNIEDNTVLAAYATLGFNSTNNDPNTASDSTAQGFSSLLLPGLHLAADIELFSWLYFRSGLAYHYELNMTSQQTANGDATTSQTNGVFGWRTGIGIVAGNFLFDGTLQQGFITGGPDFLGGQGNGLFSMVSASYKF